MLVWKCGPPPLPSPSLPPSLSRLLSQPTSLADNHTPTAAVGGATSEVCSTELVPPTRNSDSRAQSGGTQIQDSHTVHLTSKLVASVPKGEAQVVDSLQLDDMFITAQDFQVCLSYLFSCMDGGQFVHVYTAYMSFSFLIRGQTLFSQKQFLLSFSYILFQLLTTTGNLGTRS